MVNSLRKLFVKNIVEAFSEGYDEFNMICYQYDLGELASFMDSYDNEQKCDLEELRNILMHISDEALISCYRAQCCQMFR